jgi:restriction endonuclease-like protein
LTDAKLNVSYQKRLKKHLAEFKRLHLGITEPGVFRYRRRDVLCHHILPREKAAASVFDEAAPTVNAFLAANPRKRHRYFHHLNSLQAFAFNLFFPYFSSGPEASSALLGALGQDGAQAEWEPEAVPGPEEETNIDVSWITSDGVRTFCEVKLSENDFGKAVDDAEHRGKLQNIYSQVLAPHLHATCLEPTRFFGAYQFNRNVWHMVRTNSSWLIFLLPRANSRLWTLLQGLLSEVEPAARDRISAVAIEDVIASLCADDQCPEALRDYALKLKRKYVIEGSA